LLQLALNLIFLEDPELKTGVTSMDNNIKVKSSDSSVHKI